VRVFDSKFHSRMPLGPTPARLKLLKACDQWHSSRVFTPLTGWHRKFRPNTEGNVTKLLQSEGMWSVDEPTVIIFTDENGAPTDACAQIGGNNLPFRGGKCSIWEGGTKGISIVASPLLVKTNYTYHGLTHAVDWLPTLVAGVLAGSTASTKPLDGHNLWDALLANDPSQSTRTDIYYGITDSAVGIYGPALRTADGMKIVLGGWGGGTGEYRLLNGSYVAGEPAAVGAWGSSAAHAASSASTMFYAESSLVAAHGRSNAATCGLNVSVGKCCPGNVLLSISGVSDTSTCCALCKAHVAHGCTSFTLNKGQATCYLKTLAESSNDGNCDCGHPGPLPPARPPPPPSPNHHNSSKILLYNVETDSAEKVEMATAHQDVVAKLHALVRCSFSDGFLHSRMSLEPTNVRLNRTFA
jgi:hypothetical protein